MCQERHTLEKCNWFGVYMRLVGIMQGYKNPGDHVFFFFVPYV